MWRTFLLLALISQLVGCANCAVESYYKSAVENQGWKIRNSSNPSHADLDVKGKALVSVVFCPDHNSEALEGTRKLCISILLAENSTFQFLDSRFELRSDAESAAAMVQLGAIEYPVFCKSNPSGERECSSSEASPVDGSREKRADSTMSQYLDHYSFAPTMRFHGAADTIEQGAYFGHRIPIRRRYILKTGQSIYLKAEPVEVRLPPINLDGRHVTLPSIKFKPVTEEVCRPIHYG